MTTLQEQLAQAEANRDKAIKAKLKEKNNG
jgi:hypothetical protein